MMPAAGPPRRPATPWYVVQALGIVLAATAFAAEAPKGVRVSTDFWVTRVGLSARVLIMAPERPRAGVLLLPGGHGNINLDVQGQIGWGEDDFVIRTRTHYARAGFTTVLPDVSGDQKPPAKLDGYRRSPLQADDLRALSGQMQRMVGQVFVVAYDRGATSALNLAGRGKMDAVAGLVLISPVFEKGQDADAILDEGARLALGALPILVIHHGQDTCSAGAVARLEQIAAGLTPRRFESVALTEGQDDIILRDPFAYYHDPCNKEAHHALAGLDERVSTMVVEWLEKQVSTPTQP